MLSEPHLSVCLQHRIGALTLDVAFTTSSAWTVLFGPSGSGKSTVLRAIAGLIRPHQGSITINDQLVCNPERGVCLSPQLRPVRWSAQHPALFPHLSVAQNLAFGLTRSSGLSATQVRSAAEEALAHFHLESLSSRRPAQRSGGEQQRVAVARAAIGARGKLLLLDEPFTGLDTEVRNRLVADLRAWLGASPVVSVTHNVAETILLQAEVVRLAQGQVTAQGPAVGVLAHERSQLLAALQQAS
jgi:molybdate transport system ATP-binding protein